MTFTFRVKIPFDALIFETEETSIQSSIPEFSTGNMTVREFSPGEYCVEMEVSAANPVSAMRTAVMQTERLLKLLAASNDGFGIRSSLIKAELVDGPPAELSVNPEGNVGGLATDVAFLREHGGILKIKGHPSREIAVLDRYDDLDQYVQDCLDINQLVVTSDRPQVRWLLAVTGLQALTDGAIGPQQQLGDDLTKATKRVLRSGVKSHFMQAGISNALQDRANDQILRTTCTPVARHILKYLTESAGINDVTESEINEWWLTRGKVAHGVAVEIDLSALNRLIITFQQALRKAASLEDIR
ncbi:hypothetical protein [Streptomyces europaeiscabiei]|uniref:hypothetical protein n=1 Tax=Streptomyces europaeiscabiei TaxID=146819 RepID=UPI0029A0F3E2|nr:hypothetical protein [Streptomyces europaeiscabiei]MDX2762083.1 hypothetical protein [Streptomyces europaeiscabiei]